MENKILLFNKWDLSEVKIHDPGLERYINIKPVIVPRTYGKYSTISLSKRKMNIVERFMNKMMIPGHRGKKHRLTSGRCSGNYETIYKAVKNAFEKIHEKTKKNPVQVLVTAIENAAVFEEIAAYRLGGIIARRAVITSPQRRVDLALRHLTQGIYKGNFKTKRPLWESIVEEILAAYNNDKKSFAITERQRLEKEAEGAR